MPTVQLHPAHEWTCPTCGTVNFEHGAAVEFTPEDARRMHEQYPEVPVEEWLQRGDWLTAPEEVECRQCHGVFDATEDGPPRLESEDSDTP